MRLTIIGCSDAFSSGGRYHSCYLLDTAQGRLMLDCGANSPLALKRAGIEMASIDAIVISHCHGDHFGGVPFLLLDRMFIERGPKPVEILGPPGIAPRTTDLFEALYPSLSSFPKDFEILYRELEPRHASSWRGIQISAYEVEHYSGSPSLALSISDGAKRFAFSGDSAWCDGVIEAGRGADLYLIECTTFSTKTPVHLDYLTLAEKFGAIGAKRYLLTHMSPEMLGAADKIDISRCILAEDGLSIVI
jgi:ribonuclease BN (tRNA processing enzyme)